MSSGMPAMGTTTCLICDQEQPVVGFLSHIRQHFNYQRYKCCDCDYKCDSAEDSAVHKCKAQHDIQFVSHNYLEKLAAKVFSDCLSNEVENDSAKAEENVEIESEDSRATILPRQVKRMRKNSNRNVQSTEHQDSSVLEVRLSERRASESDKGYFQPPNLIAYNRKVGSSESAKKAGNTLVATDVVDGLSTKVGNRNVTNECSVNDKNESITSNKFIECAKRISNGRVNHEIRSINEFNLKNEPHDSSWISIKDQGEEGALNDVKPVTQNAGVTDKVKDIKMDSYKMHPSSVPVVKELPRQLNQIKVPSELSKTFGEVFQLNTKTKIACKKCGLLVCASYSSRKDHAWFSHFVQKDDPEAEYLLPETVRACFPTFEVINDLQCNKCGVECSNAQSRVQHLTNFHCDFTCWCPLPNCQYFTSSYSSVKGHLKEFHRVISVKKMDISIRRKLFQISRSQQSSMLSEQLVCFPFPIPKSRSSLSALKLDSDHRGGIPKPSMSSKISSILNQNTSCNKPIMSRRIVFDSSSDSDDSNEGSKTGFDAQKDALAVLMSEDPSHSSSWLYLEKPSTSIVDDGSGAKPSASTDVNMFPVSANTISQVSSPSFQCNLCVKKVERELMEVHAWEHLPEAVRHSTPSEFKCEYCGGTFAIPDIFSHVRTTHNGAFVSPTAVPPNHILLLLLKQTATCFLG